MNLRTPPKTRRSDTIMSSPSAETSDFVALGHITRPHGVHGAIIIVPYTDNIDLILAGRGLKMLSPEGKIRSVSGLKGKEAAQGLIVKITGITDRDEAQKLKGWTIGMERGNLPPVEEDEVYWADLVGLEVFAEGRSIGLVENLMEVGTGLLLVVIEPDQPDKERLIPFNEEFVVSVEPDEGRIALDLPPGLLDL
ncbi:16S rRNA processing protein RimM [Deltaproteobacteria bacterium Smac51]|nr:16S rRNA processing protein RimM [Deltaproteobacteria bacterium Smac51]